MAKTRFIQNAFTSGVLSSLLKGRTDLSQYYNAVEVGDNWVVIPQGGIKRRPGTRFISKGVNELTRNTTTPTTPNGGSGANMNDGLLNFLSVSTTPIGTINPYVIGVYDLGSAKTIKFADARIIYLSTLTSIATSLRIGYSDDNVVWVDGEVLGDGLDNGVANAKNFRKDVSGLGSHRYWRLSLIDPADLGAAVVTVAEFNLIEETSTVSPLKLAEFNVSSSEQYLLSFSAGNVAIFSKKAQSEIDTVDTLKANLFTPYVSSDIPDIRVVQTENVMLVFHEDHPTKRIIYQSPTIWTIDDFPYVNIPQFDYNDSNSPPPGDDVQVVTFASFVAGDTYQVDVEGVLSKNITFAGDFTADEQDSTAANLTKNLQDMPVFGATGVLAERSGVNEYTITISGESAKDFELFSGFATTGTASKTLTFVKSASGAPRKEDLWSANRGYPKSGAFHDGRLVLGGTKTKPQSLLFSRPGLFNDFILDEGDDDEGIFITLVNKKLVNIVDVFSARNLVIFTDGAEFAVFDSPITPSSITVKNQTSYGSKNIEADEVDGTILFADRNGKSIKAFVYDFNEDAYISKDISVLSPELISNPVDMAILTGNSSEDANWVFIVNDDGNATILNTLREQDINAFTHWTSSGDIISTSVVDDALYMVVKRTINGADVYHIEQWNFERRMDDALLQTNIAPLATIDNLDHLEGETVSIVADGIVLQDRVVSSGAITLTDEEQGHTNYEVGLKFTPTLRPMPVNTNIGSGQNQMRIKKITRINVRVKDTYGLYVDGQAIPLRAFSESPSTLDQPPTSFSGIIDDFYIDDGWDRYDTMPEFTLPDPTPCTILGIEYEVESS